FGVSHAGIDFDAIDGKPTHLFFALIAPENSAGIHLKALARISRLFKSAQFRSSIMQAKSADEIYELIAREAGRSYLWLSRISVTGPSLTSETFIWAAKIPVCTSRPSDRARSQKSS